MNLQFFSKKIQLPKGKLNHIQKHNIQSLKNQAQYLSDKQLKLKLENSFFSPKWSKEKINKNVEIAYNALLKKGKRGDTFPYKIDGETIKIYIERDGKFRTAYGTYEYTVKQFKKMMK